MKLSEALRNDPESSSSEPIELPVKRVSITKVSRPLPEIAQKVLDWATANAFNQKFGLENQVINKLTGSNIETLPFGGSNIQIQLPPQSPTATPTQPATPTVPTPAGSPLKSALIGAGLALGGASSLGLLYQALKPAPKIEAPQPDSAAWRLKWKWDENGNPVLKSESGDASVNGSSAGGSVEPSNP